MSVRPGFKSAFAALAIAVTATAAYLPAVRNGFAYDDVVVVQQDTRIHSLDHIGSIFAGGYWQSDDLALYRPMTTLSFAIDWAIGNGSATWFHVSNLLLHVVVSILAFFLLARLFARTPAFAGALVFALHPVHVEAVANIVGRAEILSAGFVLAAGLLWTSPRNGAFAEPRLAGAGGPRGPGRTLAIAGLFALGLLSKESAVMLPAVLVLLDIGQGSVHPGRLRAWLRARAMPMLTLAVVLVCYFWLRAEAIGSVLPARVDPILEVAQTPLHRVFTALQAWPVWMRLLFFPDLLLADYGPRVLGPALWLTAEGVLGLVLMVAIVLGGVTAWRREQHLLSLGLLWFPVTILPVSNLIVPIGVLVAERTLYLPSFVIAMLIAGTASWIAAHRAAARPLATAALAVVLLALGARTFTRSPEWASTDAIMLALVRDRPDAFRGRWHAARKARAAGQLRRAMAEYDTAIVLWPFRQRLILEAIGFAAEQRHYARAFQLAQHAALQWPGDVDVQRQLAGSALDAGDLTVARRAIQAGLRLSPGDSLLRRMAAFADSAHGADR